MNREKIYKISDMVAEYAIYAGIFFIPISIALVEISCVLAILAFIIKKSIRPDFRFIKENKAIYLWLLVFVVFLALSMFNSGPLLMKSLRAFFSKWLEYILVCVVAADVFRGLERQKKVVIVTFFSAALCVLSGFSQILFGFEFIKHKELITVRGEM